jgi:hypothetical protein
MHMPPKSLPDFIRTELENRIQRSLTRECITDSGNQLRTIASLTLNTLIEVISGLPKPHKNDKSRSET